VLKTQSNIPDQKLRWTMRRAAAEFATGYHVLCRKMQQAGEIAGEDGLYVTDQLVTALYGDLHRARVRKLDADCERSETLTAQLKGELIDRQALREAFT
jgi:hypothetical protein